VPIPAQELGVRAAYSFLLNTPLFNKFMTAYNGAVDTLI